MIIAFQRDDDRDCLFLAFRRLALPPPKLELQVILNGVDARVVFGDLDESVLLDGLKKAELGEQQTKPRRLFRS